MLALFLVFALQQPSISVFVVSDIAFGFFLKPMLTFDHIHGPFVLFIYAGAFHQFVVDYLQSLELLTLLLEVSLISNSLFRHLLLELFLFLDLLHYLLAHGL